MAWRESTMCLRGLALLYCKVMITKSVKSHLTHKEIRLLRQAVTRRAESGQRRLAMKFRSSTVMKMKSSHALSTTKEIQLLRDPRTTRAVFGRTNKS